MLGAPTRSGKEPAGRAHELDVVTVSVERSQSPSPKAPSADLFALKVAPSKRTPDVPAPPVLRMQETIVEESAPKPAPPVPDSGKDTSAGIRKSPSRSADPARTHSVPEIVSVQGGADAMQVRSPKPLRAVSEVLKVDGPSRAGSALFRKKALEVKQVISSKNSMTALARTSSNRGPVARSAPVHHDLLKEVGHFLDTTDVVAHYNVGKQEKRQTSAVKRVKYLTILAQVACMIYAGLILVDRYQDNPGQPGLTVWDTKQYYTPFDALCDAKCAEKWAKPSPAICEKDLLCSWGLAEVLLLAAARVTAYAMYAPLIFIFVSKCKGIGTILHGSGLELWLPLPELHEFHVLMGHELWILGLAHTVCHLIRWGLRGSASFKLLWSSACGRSGAIAMFMLMPIMFMAGPRRLRKLVSWEVRKVMHMTSIGYAIALCFHSTNMAGVMAFSLLLYVADVLLVYGMFTWKSEETLFSNVGTGTQVSYNIHRHTACASHTTQHLS
jgi:hypothetical protein